MARFGPEIIICAIVIFTSSAFYIINKSLTGALSNNIDQSYDWILRGCLNISTYLTVLLPGYFVFKYVRKINYLDKSETGCFGRLIRLCFDEEELIDRTNTAPPLSSQRTIYQDAILLTYYFFILQISFLSWGILQEKVMTQQYTNGAGDVEHFKNSQFLVFVNRILAFCLSGLIILCTRQPRHKCPLYKYAFCSISNVMSSWCQYEALKYVSFPHQVLAKAAKTIPVMIMGKIVSRTKYECYEYVTAVILSMGMLFFMLDSGTRNGPTVTTLSGIFLLCSYIAFDSFTANWQSALFKKFAMSPIQMMCAVNFFSCIFTAVSLIQQSGFMNSIDFMIKFPTFITDCLLLSLCSAAGQLFIFKTISAFGPLVFAIISTIRQGFSVFLSCLIYKHDISALGVFGIILVFLSVLLKIYCSYRLKTLRKHQQSTKNTNNLKM